VARTLTRGAARRDAASNEVVVVRVDRGAVAEGEGLVAETVGRIDRPMAGVDLGEGRALRRGAEAGEQQAVAGGGAVAAKSARVSPWASPRPNTKVSKPSAPSRASAPPLP
jgi:hypothetical protein